MSDPLTEQVANAASNVKEAAKDGGWWAVIGGLIYLARQAWIGRTKRVIKKDEHADRGEERKAARVAREHATLDRVIQSDRERLRSLESRLEKMSDRLDTAEQKLADARVDIARLEVELKNKDSQIASLHTSLAESQAETRAVMAQLADVEGERDRIENKYREAAAQVRLLCQSRDDSIDDEPSAIPPLASPDVIG